MQLFRKERWTFKPWTHHAFLSLYNMNRITIMTNNYCWKKLDKTKQSLASQNCTCDPRKCTTLSFQVIFAIGSIARSFPGLVLVSSCGYTLVASRLLCFVWNLLFLLNNATFKIGNMLQKENGWCEMITYINRGCIHSTHEYMSHPRIPVFLILPRLIISYHITFKYLYHRQNIQALIYLLYNVWFHSLCQRFGFGLIHWCKLV